MNFFSVIGNPIKHSLSPLIHNTANIVLNLDASYGRILLDKKEDLENVFLDFYLSGANITLPFKEKAFEIANEVRGIAKDIKALNTLVLDSNSLIGYNTDAMGFYKTLESKQFKNALILGAGGSAKAVAFILKQKGVNVSILNRSDRKSEFSEFNFFLDSREIENTDLIINATSASLKNELPLEINELNRLFKNASLTYDLMYGITSPFLELAKDNNLAIKDGLDMLIFQAVFSFILFHEKALKEKGLLKSSGLEVLESSMESSLVEHIFNIMKKSI